MGGLDSFPISTRVYNCHGERKVNHKPIMVDEKEYYSNVPIRGPPQGAL